MSDPNRPADPGADPGADTVRTPTPATSAAAATPPPAAAPLTPEPADAPAATSPVTPPPAAPARPRSRIRWIAAIGIVALVVAGSATAALMLTGSQPTATVLGYVPADSVAYAELRLDLPGDQRQQLGQFLSHFPGFADQAALDTKVNEALDRFVSGATDGKQTYTADIAPWFDGELALAVGPLPPASALEDPAAMGKDGRALILASVSDAAKAQTWFDGVMAGGDTPVTTTTETYGDEQLTVVTDAEVAGGQAAFVIIDDKVAVAGDLASVKAAIDTDGKSEFSKDPSFTAAAKATDGASIAFAWADLETIKSRMADLAAGADGSAALTGAAMDLIPDWIAGRVRVEGDALVIDGVMPHNDALPGPDANAVNDVAQWAPPSTLLLASANDYGATLQETIDLVRADPELKDPFGGIDTATGMLGGLDAVLGWMGDTGIVISHDGDAIEGGIISIPNDANAANQLVTTLKGFVTLAGAQSGMTLSEETYNGTTITVVDLGSARDLMGMAGAMGGGSLPADPSSLPVEGNIQLAVAVTDGVVVIGSGPDFVKSVLDAGAGQSLADDARFSDLVKRVGAEGTGLTFVDIAAVRGLVEANLAGLPGADRTEYEESVKPFLAPLDAMVAAGEVGADTDSQHVILTVK